MTPPAREKPCPPHRTGIGDPGYSSHSIFLIGGVVGGDEGVVDDEEFHDLMKKKPPTKPASKPGAKTAKPSAKPAPKQGKPKQPPPPPPTPDEDEDEQKEEEDEDDDENDSESE